MFRHPGCARDPWRQGDVRGTDRNMKKWATGPGRNTTARRAGGQAMADMRMQRRGAARVRAWGHRMCGKNPRGVQSILGHGWGGRCPALLPERDLPYRRVCHPVSCRWGTPARQRQVVRGMCPHAVAWPEKRPVSVCRACMMHAGWRKSCLLASCRFGHARKAAGPGVVHHGWAAWRNESIPARGACVYPADGWPVR